MGDTVFLTIRVPPSFLKVLSLFIWCCCCCCCFWPYHYETCGILVPRPRIKPMPLHWKCSILTAGPPGTSPTICWSNQYFYLFVKHLPSPCSAPYIIHCMLQIQRVWAPMAAEGWGNRSRQRFNNLHGGSDRARKPSQAAGLQGLCLQHPCHELHEVFWVSEGEVSWPRWHLPTQDASQVCVTLTLAPPSAPVSPGGTGSQGGRQAGGLTSWVWLRGEIQPVLLVWAKKWAEPPQPPPTTHAAPVSLQFLSFPLQDWMGVRAKKRSRLGTSLVAHGLEFPVQGVWVWPLVGDLISHMQSRK